MNLVKKEARKLVFSKVKGHIERAGERQTLEAAAASLRVLGSTSRAALVEVHIPLSAWGKLRKPPDVEVLNKIVTIIEPLNNPGTSKMVFGESGEREDGTGAAWLYLEAIGEIATGANNRFSREVLTIVAKAKAKLGTPHHAITDPAKAEELANFVKGYIKDVVL